MSLFFNSMIYDRDSGYKSFFEDVFENEFCFFGGSWGFFIVFWIDVVGIVLN